MGFIEVHVHNSGRKVSINTDNISQVGIMNGHGIVHRVDGGSVETEENYVDLLALVSKAEGSDELRK